MQPRTSVHLIILTDPNSYDNARIWVPKWRNDWTFSEYLYAGVDFGFPFGFVYEFRDARSGQGFRETLSGIVRNLRVSDLVVLVTIVRLEARVVLEEVS